MVFEVPVPGPFEMLILGGLCVVVCGGIVAVVVIALAASRRPNPDFVPCPSCGKAVGRFAESCPHCGRALLGPPRE